MLGRAALCLLLAGCGSSEAHPLFVDVEPPATGSRPVTPDGTPVVMPKANASPPLFTYERNGNAFDFDAEGGVNLRRRSGPPCRSELADGGNMYTRDDVNDAFSADAVESALASRHRFRASVPAKVTAADAGTIRWEPGCTRCPAAPPDVARFKSIVDVVLANRMLVCP